MAGSIGCGALSVSGQGGDSVIRLREVILNDVSFPEAQGIQESISDSVSIIIS